MADFAAGAGLDRFGAELFPRFDERVFLGEVSVVPRRPVVTRGQSSVELEVRLPKNAVVRRFDLRVRARRADAAPLGAVAQVRPAEARAGGVVVDFGLLRTVSGFVAPEGFAVRQVFLWLGSGFAPQPHWTAGSPPAPTAAARFDEARTERLLVVLDALPGDEALAGQALVLLPEAPADLELRIDGGAPVWTSPGPVIPGAATEPNADSWSAEGERIIPLAAALAPFVGDPLGEGEVVLALALSSRVPGVLALVDVTQAVSTISRATLGGAPARDLDFPGEGEIAVDLDLPAAPSTGRIFEEVRFTVAGSLAEERTLDPLRPSLPSSALPLAELLADPGHAFAVRLDGAPGRPDRPGFERLAELMGVRLPLLAGPSGGEARIALWREGPGRPGEPAEPLPQGVSEPVTLDPPPSGSAAAVWVTFPFKTAVPLAAPERLWAALVLGRGSAAWPLALPEGSEHAVRRGGSAGPWYPLPAVFTSDPELLGRRGAVRVVGRAPKDSPLAPLRATLAGASEGLEVTPVAKGVRQTLAPLDPPRADRPRLAVTSRVAGRVSLREVDVVWRAAETVA